MRNFVLNEPRGGVFRHVNLLVLPNRPEADAAFIIMEPEDMPPMSGSNAICVSTVLLDAGILPMHEPVTEFTLEAPRRVGAGAGRRPLRSPCGVPSGRSSRSSPSSERLPRRPSHPSYRRRHLCRSTASNGCKGSSAAHILRRSASPQTIAVDEDFTAQHPLVIDARLAHPQENSPADCFLFFGYS